MSKHTPGPWVVRESSLSVSVVGMNSEVVFHESDKRIPGVMDDARIIAAAPELLEACQALLTHHDYEGYVTAAHMARVAIAKALGNQ